jgi:single-strand DNA-binding protein
MNKVILMGRLTRDPEVRYSQGENLAIARYTLAVDRRFKSKNDETTADFIDCTAFGKSAEFAEKYFHKGIKIAVTGRLENNNYTNKEGVKVYSMRVIVDDQEFAESKNASGGGGGGGSYESDNRPAPAATDDFMNIPDGIDEELPFN